MNADEHRSEPLGFIRVYPCSSVVNSRCLAYDVNRGLEGSPLEEEDD